MLPNVCVCDKGFGGTECTKYVTPFFSSTSANRSEGLYLDGHDVAVALASETPGAMVLEEPLTVHRPLAPAHILKKKHKQAEVVESPIGTWVSFPHLDAFDFTPNVTSFTLSAWVRLTAATAAKDDAAIVSYGDFRKGPGYGMGVLRGGNVYCGVGTSALPLRASMVAVAVSEESFLQSGDFRFRHIACVYDVPRARLTLYVDGVGAALRQNFPFTGGNILASPQGSVDVSSFKQLAPHTPSDIQVPFVIGASWDMQGEFFDGEISEVVLRSEASTAEMLDQWRWKHLTQADENTRFLVPLSDCELGLPYVEALTMHDREQQAVHLILATNTNKHIPLCRSVHHPLAASDSTLVQQQDD